MTTAYMNHNRDGTGVNASNTFKTWNNWDENLTSVVSLLDEDGVDTGWDVQYASGQLPEDGNNAGVNAVGTGDAAWVDEAVISNEYNYADNNNVPTTSDEIMINITNLSASTTYYIEVFSSRGGSVGSRPAEFFSDSSLTTSEGTLESQDNSTNTLSWSFVSDGSGNGFLGVKPANASSFGYLNAWRISDSANFDEGGTTTSIFRNHLNQQLSQ